MKAKIIDFKRKAALLLHRHKQSEVVNKMINANLEIERLLRDWQNDTNKKIADIPFHKLPKRIQQLLNQYQVNHHLLLNKYDIHLPVNI